jgi:predicted Zn-dependent protease
VARRIDPLSLEVPRETAQVQIQAGRFEEAIANLERVLAVDPAFPYANLYLGRALMFTGRLSEAIPC